MPRLPAQALIPPCPDTRLKPPVPSLPRPGSGRGCVPALTHGSGHCPVHALSQAQVPFPSLMSPPAQPPSSICPDSNSDPVPAPTQDQTQPCPYPDLRFRSQPSPALTLAQASEQPLA